MRATCFTEINQAGWLVPPVWPSSPLKRWCVVRERITLGVRRLRSRSPANEMHEAHLGVPPLGILRAAMRAASKGLTLRESKSLESGETLNDAF
jgi:hypothetical protein